MHPGPKSLLSVPQRGRGEARPHGGQDRALLSSESVQSSREEDESPTGVIRGVRCQLGAGRKEGGQVLEREPQHGRTSLASPGNSPSL